MQFSPYLSSYLSVLVGVLGHVLGCYLLAISSVIPWGMWNPGCVDDLVLAYEPLCTVLFFFWFLAFLLQFLAQSPVLFPLCCCHVWFYEYFLHSLHLSQVFGVLDHQPLCLFVLEPHFHRPRGWSVFGFICVILSMLTLMLSLLTQIFFISCKSCFTLVSWWSELDSGTPETMSLSFTSVATITGAWAFF